VADDDAAASSAGLFPFRTLDCPGDPHPGLRAYPFLGQASEEGV
jgi:hypothetical protein